MDASRLAINCSLALKDVPVRERAARARALGYEAVEFWWPFEAQLPDRREVREFVGGIRAAELQTLLLNFPGGGPSVGDRGLLCVPGREDDFARAAELTVGIGSQLGVRCYNPMVGNTTDEWTPGSEAFDTALRNLVRIAPVVRESDGTIVIEPLSGFPQAAIKTFAQASALIRAARREGAENVAILFDLYHAAVNEDDILENPAAEVDLVGHIQVADAPGRGWPGTADLPLAGWLSSILDAGYRGRVGLECTGDPVPAAELAARL